MSRIRRGRKPRSPIAVRAWSLLRIAEIDASEEWTALRGSYPADVADVCGLPGVTDAYAVCREIDAVEATEVAAFLVAGLSGIGALTACVLHGTSSPDRPGTRVGVGPGGVTVEGRF